MTCSASLEQFQLQLQQLLHVHDQLQDELCSAREEGARLQQRLDGLEGKKAPVAAQVQRSMPPEHMGDEYSEISGDNTEGLTLSNTLDPTSKGVDVAFYRDSSQRRSIQTIHDRLHELSAEWDASRNSFHRFTQDWDGCLHQKCLDLKCAQSIRFSRTFEIGSSLLILAYVVFLLVESDSKVRASFSKGGYQGWLSATQIEVADVAFFSFFLVEMTIRLLAEELDFFFGKDWKWNLFDFSIVSASSIELIGAPVWADAKMWRSVRVVRILRALRVIRVIHVFRDLRVLIDSLFHVAMPLMGAVALLLLLLVLVSIIFSYASALYVDGLPPGNKGSSETLEKYFGSISKALLSLLMSLTGGESWIFIISPLWQISWTLGILFVIFILAMQLGVLNVVTSIFVAAAASYADMDTEAVTLHEVELRALVTQKLKIIFDTFDYDRSGFVSLGEFEQLTKDTKVAAFFEKFLGVQTWKVNRFFRLLDVNHDEQLSKEEFVMGSLQSTGQAKNIDLESLRHLCHMIRSEVKVLGEKVSKAQHSPSF